MFLIVYSKRLNVINSWEQVRKTVFFFPLPPFLSLAGWLAGIAQLVYMLKAVVYTIPYESPSNNNNSMYIYHLQDGHKVIVNSSCFSLVLIFLGFQHKCFHCEE